MTQKKDEEGWGWPSNSRKAHYMRGFTSICGGWMYSGQLFQGNETSSDNCAKCVKIRQKELSEKK